VRKAFDFESFSGMLAGQEPAACYHPDEGLSEEFSSFAPLSEGTCATVGSLALEEENLPRFRALGVNCLDMECSAVFSAAKKGGKRALALLYVSNRAPDKPWHEHLDRRDIQRLGRSRQDLAALLMRFIDKLL
jgi:nucleoside phosphorylase